MRIGGLLGEAFFGLFGDGGAIFAVAAEIEFEAGGVEEWIVGMGFGSRVEDQVNRGAMIGEAISEVAGLIGLLEDGRYGWGRFADGLAWEEASRKREEPDENHLANFWTRQFLISAMSKPSLSTAM